MTDLSTDAARTLLDLDAARARRREAAGASAGIMRFAGVDYELPPELKLTVLEAFGRMMREGDLDAIIDATRDLWPDVIERKTFLAGDVDDELIAGRVVTLPREPGAEVDTLEADVIVDRPWRRLLDAGFALDDFVAVMEGLGERYGIEGGLPSS